MTLHVQSGAAWAFYEALLSGTIWARGRPHFWNEPLGTPKLSGCLGHHAEWRAVTAVWGLWVYFTSDDKKKNVYKWHCLCSQPWWKRIPPAFWLLMDNELQLPNFSLSLKASPSYTSRTETSVSEVPWVNTCTVIPLISKWLISLAPEVSVSWKVYCSLAWGLREPAPWKLIPF